MDFKSPKCVTEALIERAELGLFAYELKSESYYSSIVDWYKKRYSWNIKSDWISSSPVIWAGVRICVDSFTNLGEKILAHSPTFHPINDIVEKSGRVLIQSSLILNDGYYSIDFVDFENKIVENNIKMFVLVPPQNSSYGEGFSRINIGCSKELLSEALARIKLSVNSLCK